MITWSKLKRDFLAALPALNPHNDIERVLLLAGKKPVGFFDILIGQEAEQAEELRDIEILDRAAAVGRLHSVKRIEPPYQVHYYCQPNKIDELNAFLEEHERKYIDARRLGYRCRDMFFFHVVQNAPDPILSRIEKWNEPIRKAYREKLLEGCNIDSTII